MYTFRRVFAFLAAVGFVLGIAGHGQAQVGTAASVTLTKTGVSHSRPNRGNNLLNTQINYDDCHLDDQIEFTVSLSANFANYSLQLWAGSGCDDKNTRLSTSVLNCWQLAGTGMAPPSINPPAIPVMVRQILYGKTLASGTSSGVSAGTSGSSGGGAGGTDSGGDTSAGSGGSATASSGGAATTSGDPGCTDKNAISTAQNVSVFIMLVDGNNVVAGTYAKWDATYKLLAPPPPDNVSPGIGETLLPISFSYNSGTTSDSTINGYKIYCDPPPGADAAKDAGVLPEDGGGLLIPACKGSVNLIAGQRPDDSFLCGTTGKTSKKGNATGLINGVAYNVAISTTDSYGNSGVLSKVVCEVPQPVTGFFEAYRDAGGEGGGGFCSFSRHGESLPLVVLLGFTAYWVMRRRRAT